MKQPATTPRTGLTLPPESNGVSLSLRELLNYQAQAIHWLPPEKSLWSKLNGQYRSNQQGRGMDFSEVREYQAGDDIRSIDWRVTARTGKPHTKLFTEEREYPVMLYLDYAPSMHFGSTLMLKSVQMAHFASLISWLAVKQQNRIGSVFDSGSQLHEIRPTSRHRGALRVFDQLVSFHNQTLSASQSDSTNFSRGLATLDRLCPKGSDIIICSDFTRLSHDQDRMRLAQLKRHNRVTFVHFYDPLEQGKTPFRGVEKVTNGRKTQWLNFASNQVRSKLEQTFDMGQRNLEALAHSLAIPLYSISSAAPLISQIGGNDK